MIPSNAQFQPFFHGHFTDEANIKFSHCLISCTKVFDFIGNMGASTETTYTFRASSLYAANASLKIPE